MPLLTGTLVKIGRDNFTDPDFTNLSAHTPDCIAQGLPAGCGVVGWEYGATATHWQIEFNSAVSQLATVVFMRNTVDLVKLTGGVRIWALHFRGGVDDTGWGGAVMCFCDSVGAADATVITGIWCGIRRSSASQGDVELRRYNDAGVLQETILVSGAFSHPLSGTVIYGMDIQPNGVDVTVWHQSTEALLDSAGPIVFGDFTLGLNLRDANHRRVGLFGGAGGTSGRNFSDLFTVLEVVPGTVWVLCDPALTPTTWVDCDPALTPTTWVDCA